MQEPTLSLDLIIKLSNKSIIVVCVHCVGSMFSDILKLLSSRYIFLDSSLNLFVFTKKKAAIETEAGDKSNQYFCH